MTKGPCLCGDPYCPSCGNPAAAAEEEAIELLLETIDKAGLSPGEINLITSLITTLDNGLQKFSQLLLDAQAYEYHLHIEALEARIRELESQRGGENPC